VTNNFLGIDIGGTKSQALIADASGQVLGWAEGGPGNHEDVGYEGLAETLNYITGQALTAAGLATSHLAGAGFGVAGYDWPSQLAPTLAAIQPLSLGDIPFAVVNDTIIGLLAGAPEGWGLGVVAGTRCNCWGWDQQRRVGRMTGLGTRMGEVAGAVELIDKAIEVIALEWTRRGPPTRLSARFANLVGAADAADLLEGLTLGYYRIEASAAPIVFQVAAEGDPVAMALIRWAGRGLGSLAVGVIRQLGFERQSFKIVLIGSFFDGSPTLIETMKQEVWDVAPAGQFVRLTVPPVVGGVLLAMEQAGLNSAAARKKLIQATIV
jgi:N-acetylglucosamine kinase-like BadF-type ATPase